MRHVLSLIVTLSLLHPATASAESVSRDQLPNLLAQCQQARQTKLAPLRRSQIERCIQRGLQAEHCEQRYRDYGERIQRQGSDNVIGLFWDLPECEKAIAAERYFAQNPAKDRFDYTPPPAR